MRIGKAYVIRKTNNMLIVHINQFIWAKFFFFISNSLHIRVTIKFSFFQLADLLNDVMYLFYETLHFVYGTFIRILLSSWELKLCIQQSLSSFQKKTASCHRLLCPFKNVYSIHEEIANFMNTPRQHILWIEKWIEKKNVDVNDIDRISMGLLWVLLYVCCKIHILYMGFKG